MCLSPIWTEKHETAKRLAQRMKTVLDVARYKGFRDGENPVTAIREGGVLPRVKAKVHHHDAMPWRDVPAYFASLSARTATAARALQFTILTACRTSEVLEARWAEFDFDTLVWTIPAERMKGGQAHRVPLTPEMVAILEKMKAVASEYVFEGQRRNRPLSNMSMLIRRMGKGDYTLHGFRGTFRDWASEAAGAPREAAEAALAHQIGTEVERAYARSDVLERRRELAARWSSQCAGT